MKLVITPAYDCGLPSGSKTGGENMGGDIDKKPIKL